MSELPVATVVNDEDYTIIVQGGINKRANREVFKQKDYNNLNNKPYINSTYSSSLNPVNEVVEGTLQFHRVSKTGRYSDLLDLPFIATKLTELTNDGYFVQDQYYTHTDNNLTNGLLSKINSAIQTIKVNNTLITPNANQEVNITMPTKLTDLTNDGNYVQDQNYIHTDNNFTNSLKNAYDNLVINTNQPVSANNKLATMNDISVSEGGYLMPIETYKNIVFDGVVNLNGTIPATGTYLVIENDDGLVVNKYVNGVSDEENIIIRDGYFVFVSENNIETIYYIKGNVWLNLGAGGSGSYDVVTTSQNGLMSSAMLTKLNGIAEGADNVIFTPSINSGTKIGTITINGTATDVYAPSGSSSDLTVFAGDSSGNGAYSGNSSTFLCLKDGSTVKSRTMIQGMGGTTVGTNLIGTLFITSQKGADHLYADFLTNWSSYSDGTNLTTQCGVTMSDFDDMTAGTVLVFEDANNSSLTYYATILFEKSGFPYKSGGGRYFYKVLYVLNMNGSITSYSLCCDAYGDESVYKGTTLP